MNKTSTLLNKLNIIPRIQRLYLDIIGLLKPRMKCSPETIHDTSRQGTLAAVRTVFDDDGEERLWCVDIVLPYKRYGRMYHTILFNPDVYYKYPYQVAIFQAEQLNLPEEKRQYNYLKFMEYDSLQEYVEKYLNGAAVFYNNKKQTYKIHIEPEDITQGISEGKIVSGEHNVRERRFKEYIFSIAISPVYI